MVSVITPVRNRARFIETAIESVLAQDVDDLEHVIIDGASDDGTAEIVARYHERFPDRIRFVSEPDRGGCEGFNKGYALARGRILGWLGSDDVYRPNAVRTVVAHMRAHPDDHVVYGEAEFIDSHGRVVGRFATRDFSIDRAVNEGPCVAFPAVFYRRDVVDAVGGFLVDDVVCDHEWLVRVGRRYALTRLDATICQFRLHPGSTSTSVGDHLYPRGNYLVNRRHGGRLLSPVCLRYYQSLLFAVPGMRPAWERLVTYRGFPRGLRHTDRRLAIFGAGLSGFRCLEALEARGLEAPLFIDNWPPESGVYCERPVVTPAEFVARHAEPPDVDGVIVAAAAASRHAPAMRRQLRRLGYTRPVYCTVVSL